MKKIILLSIILFFCAAQMSAQQPETKYYPVKAEDSEKVIKKKNLIVLDFRTPEEVSQGALPGAVNYNFNAAEFKDQISALPKKVPYFVYCRSGKRSAQAVEIMKSLGFTRIYEMEGGMLAYDEAKKNQK